MLLLQYQYKNSYSQDSENVAELLEGFVYNPDNKNAILRKYKDLVDNN